MVLCFVPLFPARIELLYAWKGNAFGSMLTNAEISCQRAVAHGWDGCIGEECARVAGRERGSCVAVAGQFWRLTPDCGQKKEALESCTSCGMLMGQTPG